MSNLIPFDSSNLPAYLRGAPKVSNEDLLAHASNSYPIISIKGKVFSVSRDGERNVIPNPRDPESPASNIDMVLVKVSKGTSKVWYAKGYTEGSDAKPDCWSNDGIKPDASVEKKQATSCAACAKNAWGSKVGDGGTSKGKACSDSVRMAIATPDQINDPYFIRVPAASIRNLGEYGKMLAKRGVSYQMVVTKIAFDMASPTPLLTFKPVGFLPEEGYKAVLEEAAGDTVQSILGGSGSTESTPPVEDIPMETYKAPAPTPAPQPKPTPKVDVEEVQQAVAAAAPTPKPAPKPEPTVAETTNLADIDLDSLDFDA